MRAFDLGKAGRLKPVRKSRETAYQRFKEGV